MAYCYHGVLLPWRIVTMVYLHPARAGGVRKCYHVRACVDEFHWSLGADCARMVRNREGYNHCCDAFLAADIASPVVC